LPYSSGDDIDQKGLRIQARFADLGQPAREAGSSGEDLPGGSGQGALTLAGKMRTMRPPYEKVVACHAARKGILPLNAPMRVSAVGTTIRCRVAAAAVMRGSAEQVATWRKQPVVVGSQKMPVSFLKQSEDQTVVAVQAVLSALERQGWHDRSFADWGVIAAPNLFGRISIAYSILRYVQEGAWGVSPNFIPHQSLHAMSGTVSQALKSYGPNFGISGAPNALPDAFLIAAAMVMDRQLPGLWLVLSGHESEWIPSCEGANPPAPVCRAVALALTSAEINEGGLCLSIGQEQRATTGRENIAWLPEIQLDLLAEALADTDGEPSPVRGRLMPVGKWRLDDGHWLELDTGTEGRS
jgi:hypothetical protein